MRLNLDKSVEDLHEDERAAERKNKRERFIFYAVAVIGTLVIIGGWSFYDHLQQASYDRMNVGDHEVPATLEGNVETYKHSDGKLTYRVSYKYTVEGRTYRATTDLVRMPVSERQTALYDPENPEMTRLIGTVDPEALKPSKTAQWQSAVQKGITAVLFYLVLGGYRKFREKKSAAT